MKRDGVDTSVIYQLALEVSPSGIMVVEPDGTIAMVNRELERQFAYSRDELIGRSVEMLLPEASRLVLESIREQDLRSPSTGTIAPAQELRGR